VLDGKIRGRDQGTFTGSENLESFASFAALFQAPLAGDLRKKGDLSALLGKGTARPDVPNDYCGRARSGAFDLGALQASLGDCPTLLPPLGAAPAPVGDAGASGTSGASSSSTSGGVSGSSGALGTGGTSGTSGASGITASSGAAQANPAPEDPGCGCNSASARAGETGLVWGVLAILGLRRRCRSCS
jgi:hypothetical protein